MDSREEIANDRLIQDHIGMCGTCHYCLRESKGTSCANLDSPFAAEWIDYDDGCDCYVMKRGISL